MLIVWKRISDFRVCKFLKKGLSFFIYIVDIHF
nr:MAG TPA: hypothetical protein [Caudoviricetes sp.]